MRALTRLLRRLARSPFGIASVFAAFTVPSTAAPPGAPALPDLFAGIAQEIAPSTIVATMPAQTFLENLVIDHRGIVIVTSHIDGRIHRLDGDRLVPFAQVDGKVAGIASRPGGGFVVSGSDATGKATIFSVADDGRTRPMLSLPRAIFLNGIEALGGDRYLVADSALGALWLVDAAVPSATLWLQHPQLAPARIDNPMPAANGVRRGHAAIWVSNTARQTLLRISLRPDGSAGELQVAFDRLNVDDFAVLADGSLLAATHIYNSVIRIEPSGRRVLVAGAAQGLVGSTAVALGKGPDDAPVAFVTTNGGMFMPPPEGVQPARLIQLRLPRTPAALPR